jgi:hypothetical protein
MAHELSRLRLLYPLWHFASYEVDPGSGPIVVMYEATREGYPRLTHKSVVVLGQLIEAIERNHGK